MHTIYDMGYIIMGVHVYWAIFQLTSLFNTPPVDGCRAKLRDIVVTHGDRY